MVPSLTPISAHIKHTYTKQHNRWSFGVLLYEMLDGRTPFYNKNRKYMFHCIVHVRPTFPPHFSRSARHLLFRLLEPDPARRFGSGEKGAREIMGHEFFRCVGAHWLC